MAAVAPSGLAGASKDTNQVSPAASFAVNPAANPEVFSRMIVQDEGSGGGPLLGPLINSSLFRVRVPMRLVNQLESGTSSTVLAFSARMPAGALRGVTNRLYARS